MTYIKAFVTSISIGFIAAVVAFPTQKTTAYVLVGLTMLWVVSSLPPSKDKD